MTTARILAATLAVSLLLQASPVGAQESNNPTVTVEQEPHPALYVSGAITTFAAWLLAAGFGAFTAEAEGNEVALGLLLIPVVGPFVQLGREGHDEDRAFVGVLGGLEIVGLTLCIVSNFVRRPTRDDRIAFDGRTVSLRF
jgi:hypothetical protein